MQRKCPQRIIRESQDIIIVYISDNKKKVVNCIFNHVKECIMNGKQLIILFPLILLSFFLYAQVNESGDFILSDLDKGTQLLEGWKYTPGDNPLYANPDYDDSQWLQLKTYQELSDFMQTDFKGFGWFRLKLVIPDSLQNRIYCIQFIMTGAMELFVDGKLLARHGMPSPEIEKEIPVNIELSPVFLNLDKDTVCISVRHSQNHLRLLRKAEGFQIGINSGEEGFTSYVATIIMISSQWMVFGFLLALSIVHFLLYIYYPKRKENLYYTFFVFTLIFIMLNSIIGHLSTDYFFARFDELFSLILIFAGFTTLQRFLYELFRLNLKVFRYIFTCSFIFAALSLLIFKDFAMAFFISISILFVDIIRGVIIGLRKRIFGAGYVITGTLIFVFGFLYTILSVMFDISVNDYLLFNIIFSVFFLALPVSVSMLLARWTSETNKHLSLQLVKVKELSDRTLAQEKEKKLILENQKAELETQVMERTSEISNKNEVLRQQNEEIKAQKEEITTQRDMLSSRNQAISESIQYAKKIQTAVLPRHVYIDEILPENFILFKPRDVVSGDFYWIRQINHYIVIAVADCTGHGVPGAIMSMLGISFLSEIVQKREITRPAHALNELRKQIKQALRQTGKQGEAEDGIDMALCALDTKTMVIQFAGAMNPFYLLRNGDLEEIKADRMPVGFYPNEKPEFTNHEIQLKTNDLFYLFSDGYMDQFGGENGLKFKASNFQKILLENHDKPMQIQKEKLEQHLNSWMKGYEQTDDILVMGVRV
jgi:serine phosphatase RsbU (regulator of sigma subunit)